jgi:hypothetical protein
LALSWLQPTWLPVWRGAKDRAGIYCGALRCGRTRAMRRDWSAASNQGDPVRRGIAWTCTCGCTGVAGRTRSGGSATARPTCGPACAGTNPLSFGATLRCSTQCPKGAVARGDHADGEVSRHLVNVLQGVARVV